MLLAFVVIRYPRKYADIIYAESQAQNVDYELIQAVVWTESKYRPEAVSSAGAVGLMQLMPATAQWCADVLGIEYQENNLTEPSYNIRLGVFYLNYLLQRFDEKDALAAYNAGQGNVLKWKNENLTEYPFKETRDYVERVTNSKDIYKFLNKVF